MRVSFDRVSDIYDATRGLPESVSVQVTDTILSIAAATPETTFVEPGIGTGRIALPVVQRGYHYTGLDISDNMLNELRRKLPEDSHHLTLINADATALPLTDNSFDVALIVHLLHLIPDWQQALAEIRRVLKPNGIFLYTHSQRNGLNLDEQQDNPNRSEIEQRWTSILENYGFSIEKYGASEQEVLDFLREQGATLETVVVAQWQEELTVGKWLYRHQNKMYSSCWQIPEDVFAPAVQDMEEWCLQHYPSMDYDLSQEVWFKFNVVRDWY